MTINNLLESARVEGGRRWSSHSFTAPGAGSLREVGMDFDESSKVAKRYANLKGKTFSSLTMVGVLKRRGGNFRAIGLFLCKCGSHYEAPIGRVVCGYRTHCGCESDLGACRTHGMRETPEYAAWSGMKARCLCPENRDYPRWGGAGISVCKEWSESFEAFYRDMGPKQKDTSLDRIDNLGDYEPGNCRWATASEQSSNRMDTWIVTIDGVEYVSAAEAARSYGVSETTIARWCDGYVDSRRGPRRVPPKNGCSRRRRYG